MQCLGDDSAILKKSVSSNAWPTPFRARVLPVNGSAAAAGATPAGLFTDATAASRSSAWLNSQSAARSRLPWQACRGSRQQMGSREAFCRSSAHPVYGRDSGCIQAAA